MLPVPIHPAEGTPVRSRLPEVSELRRIGISGGRAGVEPLRTADSLLTLLVAQDGRCAVCGDELVVPPNAPDSLTGVIDRNPASAAVRGLLCHRCHQALAPFRSAPELLQRAAAYLASGQTKSDGVPTCVPEAV